MKRRATSERALMRRRARLPFGPWEERDVSHERRARLRHPGEKWQGIAYLNNRYSVQLSDVLTGWGPVIHLWIRRHDGAMARSWADLQRIKDELVGPDRVALDVFPEASNLVDQANMAHLWVLPEDYVLPFTL